MEGPATLHRSKNGPLRNEGPTSVRGSTQPQIISVSASSAAHRKPSLLNLYFELTDIFWCRKFLIVSRARCPWFWGFKNEVKGGIFTAASESFFADYFCWSSVVSICFAGYWFILLLEILCNLNRNNVHFI